MDLVTNCSSVLGSSLSLPDGKLGLKIDGSGSAPCDAGIVVTPTPAFVIKTQTFCAGTDVKKLFINVCSNDAIAKPAQKKKLDDKGDEIEGLNIPVSVGPIRKSRDKAGKMCHAIDCIISPIVIGDIKLDQSGSYRDFICQVLIQCIEGKFEELRPIDQKYRLPNIMYHGYVHSKTGDVVDKDSDCAEVAKQLVRDVSKRPAIQEIDSTTKKEQQNTDKSAWSNNDLKHKLLINISIVSFGKVMSIFDFVEEVNKKATDRNKHFFIEAKTTTDEPKHLSRSQCLAQPLLYDSGPLDATTNKERRDAVEASKVLAKAKVDEGAVSTTIVEVSAYMLSVSVPGFSQTECILPVCIVPSTAKCTYSVETSELTVEVCVAQESMELSVDVGSRPWIFEKGLASRKVPNNKREKMRTIETQQGNAPETTNETEFRKDDPFLLGLPACTTVESQITKDTILPEDSFHAKDVMSQHMIEQQEEERRKKSEKIKMKRDETSSLDESVEYISVEDFQPGGKYYDPNVAKSEGKEDADYEIEVYSNDSSACMRAAESLVRKGGPAFFSNSLWSDLV